MTLFRQGWKAEEYFGDDVRALHMSTRSVYSFKADGNVSITHDAPYLDNGHSDVSEDRFHVWVKVVHTPLHSTSSCVGTFDNWLDAYYLALQTLHVPSTTH